MHEVGAATLQAPALTLRAAPSSSAPFARPSAAPPHTPAPANSSSPQLEQAPLPELSASLIPGRGPFLTLKPRHPAGGPTAQGQTQPAGLTHPGDGGASLPDDASQLRAPGSTPPHPAEVSHYPHPQPSPRLPATPDPGVSQLSCPCRRCLCRGAALGAAGDNGGPAGGALGFPCPLFSQEFESSLLSYTTLPSAFRSLNTASGHHSGFPVDKRTLGAAWLLPACPTPAPFPCADSSTTPAPQRAPLAEQPLHPTNAQLSRQRVLRIQVQAVILQVRTPSPERGGDGGGGLRPDVHESGRCRGPPRSRMAGCVTNRRMGVSGGRFPYL